MRLVIDTNAYAALLAGDHRINDELKRSDAVLLSPVVVGELLDGFGAGNQARKNREILTRFRNKQRTVTIPITDETAEWFAEIRKQLRANGTPIPINDVWIAAGCLEHGAAVLSYDDHFSKIDGLLRRPLPD